MSALVLGGIQFKGVLGSNKDLDTIIVKGIYDIEAPSGLPSVANNHGVLYVNETDSYRQQYYYSNGDGNGAGAWFRSIKISEHGNFSNISWNNM